MDKYIAQMRSPKDMHIICIDVTNKCDLDCSNCTRLLANQDSLWEMTPENFRMALRSMRGYQGIIAMIGGNPSPLLQLQAYASEDELLQTTDRFIRALRSDPSD